MLCSQVGIAGSTTTGDYVVMAGQVGVRDHVHIGRGAVLGAMAGITSDVPEGAACSAPGHTRARPETDPGHHRQAPDCAARSKALQAAVDRLQQDMGQGPNKQAA